MNFFQWSTRLKIFFTFLVLVILVIVYSVKWQVIQSLLFRPCNNILVFWSRNGCSYPMTHTQKKCLRHSVLQELCLNIIPTFANLIDYTSMKNALVPRIKKLCLGTSSLSVSYLFLSTLSYISSKTINLSHVPLWICWEWGINRKSIRKCTLHFANLYQESL